MLLFFVYMKWISLTCLNLYGKPSYSPHLKKRLLLVLLQMVSYPVLWTNLCFGIRGLLEYRTLFAVDYL
jgi:hypothetical protein